MSLKHRTFEDLMTHLRNQRELGEPSPVILLGAGASKEAGIEDMAGLYELVGAAGFAEFVDYIDERSLSERYALLGRYLSAKQPENVTRGYRALAALCANAYFEMVLTTNLDPLFDDALVEADLWRKDYVLLVNGIVRPDRLQPILNSRQPRVKVVKLHGDLYLRFMAWTPTEMDQYLEDIAPSLSPAIQGREVLVVGHSLRDERIRKLVLGTGGLVWFTTLDQAPDELAPFEQVRVVSDDRSQFEQFFPTLAANLGTGGLPVPEAGEAGVTTYTTDDLMASVFGVGDVDGHPTGTGFATATPQVVVTDTFAAQATPHGGLPLNLPSGEKISSEILTVHDHPFGPVVATRPAELGAPGLEVRRHPVRTGEPVTVAVAAGKGVGISSGTVASDIEQELDIAPLGRVANLIELRCTVASGSSGAPVVDDLRRVVGFIVAGNLTGDRPVSFMYPATRWVDEIGSNVLGRTRNE